MFDSTKKYFSERLFERDFFRIIGFSKREYATIKIIAFSKKRNAKVWYFNNLLFPLLIIYIPYVATIIHKHFNTISFDKTLLDLTITGSLSLLGLNVLRSASTYISDKLDETKVPSEYANSIDSFKTEISSLKGNLRAWVFILTFLGAITYITQASQLINGSSNVIYVFIAVIVIVTALSILVGRFIYLIETNFFDNEEVVKLLFQVLSSQKTDFEKLESDVKTWGL